MMHKGRPGSCSVPVGAKFYLHHVAELNLMFNSSRIDFVILTLTDKGVLKLQLHSKIPGREISGLSFSA